MHKIVAITKSGRVMITVIIALLCISIQLPATIFFMRVEHVLSLWQYLFGILLPTVGIGVLLQLFFTHQLIVVEIETPSDEEVTEHA